jgi:hypothetical protein
VGGFCGAPARERKGYMVDRPMGKQIYLSKLTKRYRVLLEESFTHERPEVRTPDRHWYEVLPCRGFKPGPPQEGSFIGLYSENPPTLKLYSNRPINASSIWKEIRNHPGCTADFGMDGEVVLYFPAEAELLNIVAGLAGGRKKRILTEEQRARLIEAGKAGRDALKRWRDQRVQGQHSTKNEAISPQAGGIAQGGEMDRQLVSESQ